MKSYVKRESEMILKRLLEVYPEVPSFLNYANPFQLLVAVILSAQCTDAMVNRVTPALFDAFPDPQALSQAPLETLEPLIFKTGFYKTKAAHIKDTARILVERHDSEVPGDFEQLIALPGVGRKTAHVICGTLFHQPALIVDTHFKRVVGRLGLTKETHPEGVEKDLGKWVAGKDQYKFSMAANLHGRLLCQARKPRCGECFLADLCPSAL